MNNLKLKRKSLRLTLKDIANDLTVSITTIWRIEQGNTVILTEFQQNTYRTLLGLKSDELDNLKDRTKQLEQLKQLRVDLGFTPAQIADKLNISTQYYMQLERGTKTMSNKLLDRLSKLEKDGQKNI